MTAKRNQEFYEKLARVDGFLAGVSSADGHIRDFSAYAYEIQFVSEESGIIDSLRKYYSAQAEVRISKFVKLSGGLKDLEKNISSFFFRSETGNKNLDKDIVDKRRYLSFRLVEMLFEMFDDRKVMSVYQGCGEFDKSQSSCDFFFVYVERSVVVLQFNDDRKFNSAREV